MTLIIQKVIYLIFQNLLTLTHTYLIKIEISYTQHQKKDLNLKDNIYTEYTLSTNRLNAKFLVITKN